MRKIFTFAAAVLFAAGMNAQTLTFGEGSTGGQTYGESDFTLTVAGWDGNHSATSGRYFGTVEENAKEVGMIASGGKLDGTNRSMIFNSTYSGTLELYVCSSASSERDVTVGAQVKSTSRASYTPEDSESERVVYGILSFDIKYGTTQVTTNGAIYIYKVVFTSNGEQAPAPRDTLASYVQEVKAGSFVANASDDASKVSLAYATKYNANSTACTAITFTTSIVVTDNVATDYYVKVTPAEGGFKAGDVIDFQPFTVMSATDYAGNSKKGNIRIYAGSDTNVSQIYETAATDTDKSDVTDGHEVAGDVKVHTYTLTADCDALYFGRTGNTRVNVLSFYVTREQEDPSTAIETIETATKAVKLIENGRVVILRDGVRYNILGGRL